jgi:GR25 family glycosyltransferase involved in LPS biosynthesis
MYPERSNDIIYAAKHFLQVSDMSIFIAINGSENGLYRRTLPHISLYTRYAMSVGRNDHMQLSNVGMLGCLLSHVEIWKKVQPGETIAIFEDDSIIDTTSSERMSSLSSDLEDIQWDILMLESGQPMISQGSWKNIGLYASTCAKSRIKLKERDVEIDENYNYDKMNYTVNRTDFITPNLNYTNDTKLEDNILDWIFDDKNDDIGNDNSYNDDIGNDNSYNNDIGNDNSYNNDIGNDNSYNDEDDELCTWFGTRGYLLTYSGAQILLNHVFPITVQVDSFIGLVAAFDSSFKMFWTRQNVVHWRYSYLSHIWEPCFKCYMPINAQFYIICFAFFFLLVFFNILKYKYESKFTCFR